MLIKKYIAQLEQENKALKKRQTSLMSSRKKWRYRYYNLKAKNKEDIEGWENVLDCAKFEMNQLEQKNNKQSKIIDEMANHIANWDVEEDICAKVEKPLCNNETSVPVSYCIQCVKQYFERKADKENG